MILNCCRLSRFDRRLVLFGFLPPPVHTIDEMGIAPPPRFSVACLCGIFIRIVSMRLNSSRKAVFTREIAIVDLYKGKYNSYGL